MPKAKKKDLTKNLSNEDRVIKTEMVEAGQLMANPDNQRIHGGDQQGLVSALIEDVGWVRHVLVNQRTGHVLDGHLRVTLALRKGEETKVPVDYVDLSLEEEALLLAMLDESAKMAYVDTAKRDELIRRVQDSNEHYKAISIIMSSVFDKRSDLLAEAKKISDEKQTAVMAGITADDIHLWMDVNIVIRREDKTEFFEIIDQAKLKMKTEIQADAMMKILRKWNAEQSKNKKLEENPA